MSNSALRVLAGAGAKGDPVYVDDVFSTFLWDGTGSSHVIDNGIDLSGEGGLVWIKSRSHGLSHALYDTERGNTKIIQSNSNGAEQTNSTQVTSFNNNGFTMGTGEVNYSGYTYCGWTFRKQAGFFDVATYTGTGSTQTVSHDLGCKPGVVIVKRLDNTSDWGFYARNGDSDSEIGIGYLNSYSGFTTSGIAFTATSSAVTIFNNSFNFDATASGATFVVYFFAMGGTDSDAAVFGTDGDEAVIKCGSYTGSDSTSNFINVGFEPQVVLIKKTSSGNENWFIFDSMRGVPTGFAAATLIPNSAAVESAGSYGAIDFNATGFTLTSNTAGVNYSGSNYFYMAIRRPHKPASEFAATQLFNVDAGANTSPGFDTGFPVDTGLFRIPSSSGDFDFMARLIQRRRVDSPSAGVEANKGDMAMFDFMDGWSDGLANSYIGYSWRRAPEYHDVVCYTGTGSSGATVSHNLGVVPEFIWIKRRDGSNYWECYHSALGATKHINLNSDAAVRTSSARFNDTAPTASVFTLGNDSNVNVSTGTYIAYLFASLDGIQKVGSYSGTGSNVDVDCGFSAGARFILIKRTDDAGDWYLYDSVQGIVAGNDPYLLLSSTAAQVTNTDYIDPLNAGFTVTSSAPAALNNSGSTYIFLAIA